MENKGRRATAVKASECETEGKADGEGVAASQR